ncbi:type II toxin-antitoxin system PemK/MazF family toxin [Sporosarcina sp. BP05]|uniref:type II toxin-antitoxin system PemK/MazF family toxin n=1 Tax=Sporosarcina sp. BP05 TaxID=2758726 RepID=UPI0016485F6D|nr:type II toxin-antitoxin system PemK/MazF family toxin [Sporosarcina sp. BP05]
MSSQTYQSKRDFFDDRSFSFGQVWLLNDSEIVIPQIDHLQTRKVHEERWVVVTSNNPENHHPLCPIVTVSPLSTRVDLKRNYDLNLDKANDNVKENCLLQLQLSQPILKKELYELQGDISDDKKVELQVLLESFFGLFDEEESC